ncbi:MAG: hypothetical protein M0D54_21405 [Hyphomonadaceae bacterium JAD_PAG50586_4]|nr:MAG: hypothetical protein M0D54_21405 [Hyphomonadaceae bacterium JAD_PAG50586_4]
MKTLLALSAALSLVACAHAPPPSQPLYHCIRTNSDGSLPEQIWVYLPDAARVEVVKIVQRCRRAAYVTGELDVARNQPHALVGGRLAQDGSQEPFAWLTYDDATHTANARAPSAGFDAHLAIAQGPWRMFDLDLSDLTALNAGRGAPREDFSFNALVIWPEEGAENPLRDLGAVNVRFVGAEECADAETFGYAVSGGLNGDLWLDAHNGHVVEARCYEPNHLEYRDFRLVLQSVATDAVDEWREVRLSHWRDCPENE